MVPMKSKKGEGEKVCVKCLFDNFYLMASSTASFTRILAVSNQYKYLETCKADLHGLYVLPRENDIFIWDGVIFVSSGVWAEGIFKFSLQISKE